MQAGTGSVDLEIAIGRGFDDDRQRVAELQHMYAFTCGDFLQVLIARQQGEVFLPGLP